ncbi:phage tail assembly chaperone [Pseudomonas sp. NFACC42-2]|uniref:phage tail assembly chaperone n=1 Tax=Pseudomonas sp. NFACC42-2 TaxID=1566193 RepID=UPI0008EDDFF3|nr:phage tail assembly chaperone [Pseudomonas sp. NFACC42-2]SFS27626.1 Phage tail assembly chaperone [Pseudomonas sp. NFACC42-2]
MAKFKIAQAPTFLGAVMIPVVGQEPVKVEFTFKYRNRIELAALFDEWNQRRKDGQERFGENPTVSEIIAVDTENQMQQIKDLVVGWEFDDKFDDESIKALVTSCHGTTEAVVDAYQAAFAKARTGN